MKATQEMARLQCELFISETEHANAIKYLHDVSNKVWGAKTMLEHREYQLECTKEHIKKLENTIESLKNEISSATEDKAKESEE